jgi:hypothetical protein
LLTGIEQNKRLAYAFPIILLILNQEHQLKDRQEATQAVNKVFAVI